MNLSPAHRIPLLVAGNQTVLSEFSPYLLALAELPEIEINQCELPNAGTPVPIVDD